MQFFIKSIQKICVIFAVLGGLLLLAIAAMTVISVLGRFFFNLPVHGDFEYTKQGMGIVVASFLPYCILNGGNLIVDFFTSKTIQNTQRHLDTLGAAVTGLGLLMFAWQASVAIPDVYESNEVSGNVSLPVWWIYAAMAPSLWLAVFAAIALTMKTALGDQQESEAEQILREASIIEIQKSNLSIPNTLAGEKT